MIEIPAYNANFLKPTVQKINQRVTACSCGCEGRDSHHVQNLPRRVRNIRVLDAIETRYTRFVSGHNRSIKVIAEGSYNHPSGEVRKAGLHVIVSEIDGRFIVLGWTAIED